MRRLLAAFAVALGLAACSSASPTFSLATASVDPTYWCPGGATNAPYDLHATIDARNGTGSGVTIESVSAVLTLESVNGPSSVAPRSSTTLKLTIPSACTSGRYGAATSSSADYKVTMDVTTSAGSFSITAANRHEILAA